MAKGIIYLMTTVVSGLIKIGKTGNDQFENRMRFLNCNIKLKTEPKKSLHFGS